MAKKQALTTEKLAKLLKPLADSDTVSDTPIESLTGVGINSPLIISGEEKLRAKRLIQWIHENIFGAEKVQVENYFGGELTSKKAISPLIAASSNMSLFSQTQLIVIHDASKVKAAFATELIPYLTNSAPGVFFIVVTEKINQQTPLPNKLKDGATLLEIENLDERKLGSWIKKEAKLVGASGGIAPSVIRLLIDSYGSDLISISSELAKLALLTGDDAIITEEIANQVTLRSPERTTFELIDALAKKNSLKTVEISKKLIEQGFHALQILSLLSRSFRTMLAMKHSAQVDSAIATPWFAKKLARNEKKFSEPALVDALSRLSKLDMSLKDSSGRESALLLNCLSHISSRNI